jgi:hypothetical protein
MRVWLSKSRFNIATTPSEAKKPAKKCPNIPTLSSYHARPSPSFWNIFPKNLDTCDVYTPIDVKCLELLIDKCKNDWSVWQKNISDICIKNLTFGTKTIFAYQFESINVPNASSALKNGEFMTDIIASWVNKKYVIGPFDSPPSFDFSINTLAACTAKKAKVRPIMNLSSPENCSFNDAVNPYAIRKLTMTSPYEIGCAIVKAGKGSLIAKYDIVDAFKLIPAGTDEWKFFGFQWLGKYFADITTPFGSKTAPASFDSLAETIVSVVKTMANTPENCVFRQLDDISIVAPRDSNIAELFVKKLNEVCKAINVPLAELCPNHNKAFAPSTYGNMLGINFFTKNHTWQLPFEKRNETLHMIKCFFNAQVISLLDFQKLHGKINAFANMCTFLKGFRFQQASFLKKFADENVTYLDIPMELKNEIWIWAKAILKNSDSYPIPHELVNPGIYAKTFVSDAAGGFYFKKQIDHGCASVQLNREGDVCSVSKVLWTPEFLQFADHNLGVLEAVGLLLPFLSVPGELKNREIILQTDNLAVVFAWSKRYAKNDEKLSLFIQTLHVIEAALPCKIYVEHVHRCSTYAAWLADAFT